ncbi:hypothetical protein DYB38_007859 [Aphanomyces astaci]|uniref:Uncharacterized protein n=2 Tax=Aphanomyces astaci TaxID=112090 RepID=A0A397CG24_APHAT|nr:hypothetical protein DYB38_007859 [Aphanomyces astaci]
MSYRRACKTCQRQSPEDIGQCQCEGIYRIPPHNSPSSALLTPPSTNRLEWAPPPPMLPRHHQYDAHRLGSVEREDLSAMDAGVTPLVQVGDRDMETALATVYYFVSSFPLLPAQIPPLERLWNLPPNAASPFQAMHWWLLNHPPTTTVIPRHYDHILAAVNAVVAHACVHQLPQARAYLRLHATSLLHKADLEHTYRELVHRIYAALDAVVAPLGMTLFSLGHGIVEICDEVPLSTASPVAVAAAMSSCLTQVRRHMSSPRAFEWFVAQMREMYMAMEVPSLMEVVRPRASSALLDGTWGFDRIVPSTHEMPPPPSWLCPSMLTVLRATTMGLMGFHLTTEATTSSCSIQEAMLSDDQVPSSEFILDQTHRVLRVFPNGETTMGAVSHLLAGDYIGAFHRGDGREGPSMAISLFSWPLHGVAAPDEGHAFLGPSKSMCFQVKLHTSLVDLNTLHVHMHVFAAPERPTSNGAAVDYWGMDATQRQACYDTPYEELVVELRGQYQRRTNTVAWSNR